MKSLFSRFLIMGLLVAPAAYADVTVVKKVPRGEATQTTELADMDFMQNYDRKIAALEDYTVTYVGAGTTSTKVSKARAGSKELRVKLIRKKRASQT